ncbi:MAG: TRAP transporter substrate-binding protein DctP [Dehalococcoidales bacterium]|nr:TRAP transporter substrate-binding protein DctP [Dehalococcoidales bacterium]
MTKKEVQVLLISICVILALSLPLLVGSCKSQETSTQPTSTGSTSQPTQVIKWKNAQYGPPQDAGMVAIQWFCDEVTKRSGGRIVFEHFYNGSLVATADMADAVESGLVQIACLYPTYFPSKMPLYNLSTLPAAVSPFAEETREARIIYQNIMDDWLSTPLIKEEFNKINAVPLLQNSPALTFTMFTKKPVTSLDDLKGLRIRAVSSLMDVLDTLGASGINVPPPDIYDSLNKGTIDGLILHWPLFQSFHLYDISKYWLSGMGFGIASATQVANLQAYEALPDDIKDIFKQVSDEYAEYIADVFQSQFLEAVELFEQQGIVETTTISAADRKIFDDACHASWEKSITDLTNQGLPAIEVFNSLQSTINKHVPTYEPYIME